MAGEINGVTVLFRLLSEDNVSGALNKIYGNVDKLEGALGKTNITAKQLESAMKEAGAGDSFNKVKTDLEGTTTAAGKLQADLKKVEASMKDAGDADKFPAVKKNLEDAAASADKTTTANGKLAKSFDGIKLAAGAALTGAGMYMEGFVQTCLSASITIQANNQKIGGSMGLTATQTIAATPQINAVLSQVQDATGRNINDLREIMPMVNQVTHGNMSADATSMQSISALAYAKPNSQPSDIATIYNKMVTSGSPMALGQFGMSLTDMGTTTKAFKDMNQDQRRNLIDQAINAHLGSENANMADTTAGRMAIFQGKLETFEGKLGDTFVPFLTDVLGALTPLLDFIENHSVAGVQLSTIAGGIVLVGTALTLLAGPILALQGLGIGKIATELWAYATATDATGDAGTANASKLWAFGASEDGAGNSGFINAAKVWAFGASEDGAGNSGVIDAAKVWLFAGAEDGAGVAGGAGAGAGIGTKVIAGAAGLGLSGITALALPATYMALDVINAAQFGGNLFGRTKDPLRSDIGGINALAQGFALPMILSTLATGKLGGGSWDTVEQGTWKNELGESKYLQGAAGNTISDVMYSANRFKGAAGNTVSTFADSANRFKGAAGNTATWLGGGVSDATSLYQQGVGGIRGLFNGGGVAAAAGGGGGNQGMANDIFGKNGLLDMSRFNIKMPSTAPITNWVKNVPKIFTSYLSKIPGEVGKIGQTIETDFWNGIKGMGGAIDTEINNVKQSILNAPQNVASAILNFGGTVVADFKKGLGIASPGYLYKTVTGELDYIVGAFSKYQTLAGNSAADLGTSMVSGFGRTMGNAPNMSPSFSATAVHTHYHAPITIDASHMNEQQLMELMIKLNENTLKPNAVPTVNKQTTPTTPTVSTTTPNTSTPITSNTTTPSTGGT